MQGKEQRQKWNEEHYCFTRTIVMITMPLSGYLASSSNGGAPNSLVLVWNKAVYDTHGMLGVDLYCTDIRQLTNNAERNRSFTGRTLGSAQSAEEKSMQYWPRHVKVRQALIHRLSVDDRRERKFAWPWHHINRYHDFVSRKAEARTFMSWQYSRYVNLAEDRSTRWTSAQEWLLWR